MPRLHSAQIALFLAGGLAGFGQQTTIGSKDLAELVSRGPVLTFAPPAPLTEQIGKKTGNFRFASGESPVVVIQLPAFTAPYTFRLSSECKCVGFRKQIFAPAVAFLNADLIVTRTFEDASFSLKDASMSRPVRAELDIEVSESHRTDKYLAVFTDASQVGKVGAVFTGSIGVSEIDYPLMRGLEGKVRLEIPNPKEASKKKRR